MRKGKQAGVTVWAMCRRWSSAFRLSGRGLLKQAEANNFHSTSEFLILHYPAAFASVTIAAVLPEPLADFLQTGKPPEEFPAARRRL